ncbi:(2Fe-2S)-binding protein [Robertkochia marina]|uniref:(2Fe-2S)-binding protein n=1 Tax=Robertkochia marina TaxID=1227945 RepID=A0A4S3M2Z2_9FLAO|nr:(2Fe-2S)-binding protein [Robertkochia marina]TRZ47492.1 (2Fe-2S)-binding protein [Robertkochia marina]
MMETIALTVNGTPVQLELDPATPLLYALREALELNGPKFGCGLQQCGACMVLIDGNATPSCVLPIAAVEGKEVTTLEGLASEEGTLHPVQQAFLDAQAAQCGYCLNGMVIHAVSVLDADPQAGEAEIREALDLNVCRCGTHSRILKAVLKSRKS